jgi:hypothetical protein
VPILLAAALVTIRIYNYAGVPPAELAAARAHADRIFQEAGLSLQWRICRVPSAAERATGAISRATRATSSNDACTDVLRDRGEFVLRLQASAQTHRPSHVALGDSLGDSLIDGRTGGGVLITIDPGRVRAVAAQAGTPSPLILGRAIAHEVGHLLIGTPSHSPHGLMRALWTQRELRENSAEDWQFTNGDIAQMLAGGKELGN